MSIIPETIPQYFEIFLSKFQQIRELNGLSNTEIDNFIKRFKNKI